MGLIYKSSTITIVAASAEKVTNGFLSDAKLKEPDAILPFFIYDSNCEILYPRNQNPRMLCSSDEPLFQRAWVFQELLLSPRALVFDSHKANVKCLEHSFRPVIETHLEFSFSCLDLPASVFGLTKNSHNQEQSQYHNDIEGYSDKGKDFVTFHRSRIWDLIIHEYCNKDITFFNDRLPALAGVVAELATSWNDVYLAGYWYSTIVRHIGWWRRRARLRNNVPTKIFKDIDRTKRIGSPSWSWITVPFGIAIEPMRYSNAKLVSSGVDLKSDKSSFGEVTGGYIALDTIILKISDDFDHIILDFKEPKPKPENCRLVYLGETWHDRAGTFLVVEKSPDGEFRRVGLAKLEEKHERMDLLSSTNRGTIIIK